MIVGIAEEMGTPTSIDVHINVNSTNIDNANGSHDANDGEAANGNKSAELTDAGSNASQPSKKRSIPPGGESKKGPLSLQANQSERASYSNLAPGAGFQSQDAASNTSARGSLQSRGRGRFRGVAQNQPVGHARNRGEGQLSHGGAASPVLSSPSSAKGARYAAPGLV